MLSIELGRSQRIRFRGRRAREIALREIRTVARSRRIGAQHRDATGISLAPQHFGRGVAGGATADDHDRLRHPGASRTVVAVPRRASFSPTYDAPVPLLDAPAGDRVERRSAQGLAGAQAEARVMPGTTNRIADQQPVRERGAVVRAEGTDREQFLPAPRENHRLAAHVPGEHPAVADVRDWDARGEVRPRECRGSFGHSISIEPEARPRSSLASRRASNRW